MKKIIDFFKRKYKILIPIMVVLVLLLAVYFLYREYRYDNYRNKKEVMVYQYFGGRKKEYTAVVTYNLKNVIVDVTGKDKKINYDATPIYYQKEDKILFPQEMSIILPLKSGASYRLFKYSTYGLSDGVHKITSGMESGIYNCFFLFDGSGLYFFSDEVTIKIDDMDDIKLSANSYLEVVGGYTLTYYDRENDKSEIIDIEGKQVIASNENVIVNVTDKSFNVFGNRVLLGQPYNLKPLLGNWQIKAGNDIIKFRIAIL